MGMVKAVLEHPEDLIPLTKMMMTAEKIKRQIPPEPHWRFAYSMLQKVSRSFALVIQQLDAELRNAVCIFYLVLRALDTVGSGFVRPICGKFCACTAMSKGEARFEFSGRHDPSSATYVALILLFMKACCIG